MGPDQPATLRQPRTAVSRAARGGVLFVVLSVLQRALPLLLLPVFVAVLSPDEYGRIAVLVAITGVLGAVLGLGLEPAVLRTYVQLADDPPERARFVSTLGYFTIVAPIAGAIVAALGYLWAGSTSAGSTDVVVVLLAFLATAFQTTSMVFVSAILRAQERLKPFTVVSAIQSVGAPLTALILVVVLRLGVVGWFAASLISAALALVVGLVVLEDAWQRRFSLSHLRTALRFGLPLLPHSLSHWTLNLSDRLILAAFVAASAVGVYNVAYQLAAPIGLILIAVRQGLMPMYSSAARDATIRRDLGDVATIQVHLAGFLTLGTALIGPALIWAAFPATYADAAGLIPWIALGYLFFGLYLVPVDSLSLMLGRTTWLWLPTAAAAVTNIALNIALVPWLGPVAAAINTAVAYAVLLAGVVALRRTHRGPRIPYDLRRMALGLVITGAGFIAGFALAPDPASINAVIVRIGVVGATGIVVLLLDLAWWNRRASRHVERERADTPMAHSANG